MKILLAPAQEILTENYASEYLLVSNFLKSLSRYDDIHIDAIVGGFDPCLKYKNNVKIFNLLEFKTILGIWERFKLIWLIFKKAKELTKTTDYDIIHHVMPFKLHATFNLLFLLRKKYGKKAKFVIGPIAPPHTYQPLSDWLLTLGYLSKENIFKKSLGYFKMILIKAAIISLKWISHLTCRKADAIITMHDGGKELIAKIVPDEKVIVIPPGSNILLDEHYVLRPKSHIEILGVGGLSVRKNFKTLIEIFIDIKKEFPDKNIILKIIGWWTPEQENLQKLAEKNGVAKDIIFINWVKNEDMKGYYTKAHIFCSTSRSEGFTICCLEAMGCGLPVIAMKTGGYNQAIENEVNGFLVEQNDKMTFKEYLRKLIENNELRESVGRKAQKSIIERYSWKFISMEYYNLYKKLANKQ